MLHPSGAEQIDEKGRQRQVERSHLTALGLRNVQDACVQVHVGLLHFDG